jgi:hypothetical protein
MREVKLKLPGRLAGGIDGWRFQGHCVMDVLGLGSGRIAGKCLRERTSLGIKGISRADGKPGVIARRPSPRIKGGILEATTLNGPFFGKVWTCLEQNSRLSTK